MIIVGEHIGEQMSKDLIFSMACKITDTTEKRTYNQEQFRKFFHKLNKGLKDYEINLMGDAPDNFEKQFF